jgi:hypothetical protein
MVTALTILIIYIFIEAPLRSPLLALPLPVLLLFPPGVAVSPGTTVGGVGGGGGGLSVRSSLSYSTASALQSLALLNAEYDVSEDMLRQAVGER